LISYDGEVISHESMVTTELIRSLSNIKGNVKVELPFPAPAVPLVDTPLEIYVRVKADDITRFGMTLQKTPDPKTEKAKYMTGRRCKKAYSGITSKFDCEFAARTLGLNLKRDTAIAQNNWKKAEGCYTKKKKLFYNNRGVDLYGRKPICVLDEDDEGDA